MLIYTRTKFATKEMIGNLNNRLKEIRIARGMSQNELAKVSGVHRVSIARYEIGKLSPNAKNLIRLSNALGVTIDELMKKAG